MSFQLSRKNRRCFGGTLVGLLLVLQLSAVVFPAMAAATGPTPGFEEAKQLDNVQEEGRQRVKVRTQYSEEAPRNREQRVQIHTHHGDEGNLKLS